jgi:hypothetical protein
MRPRHASRLALLLATAVIGASSTAFAAQEPVSATPPAEDAPGDRLRVFLDCFDCFPDFLRDEIDWVDFVRRAEDAEVHLLSSASQTGSGGREVVLRFVGRGRFAGHDNDLRAVTGPSDTESARRSQILRTTMVGLLDYVAQDGMPPGMEITVEAPGRSAGPERADDPWSAWVFGVAGEGSLDLEQTNQQGRWEADLNADRVTRAWKISLGAERSRQTERFNVGSDDEFEAVRRSSEVEGFVARSLGPHWSFGIDASVRTSTFGNAKLAIRGAPAVEFSVFPYKEYATRQFRIEYKAGIERAEYNERTVFGRLEEMHWRHELSAVLDQRQPWGSLRLTAQGSQYLHDRGLYRIEAGARVSWRLTRGLSLDVNASASRVRDQLSLPGRGATPEEILLRLRELHSGYEVDVSYGLRYTFGSLFNNVVNPRFGN